MPHTRVPPSTVQEILATAETDPEWASMLEHSPIPRGADYELETLKELVAATYPRMRATLDASRPKDVIEFDVNIEIPATKLKLETARNRAIVAYPLATSLQTGESNGSSRFPVMLLLHGGGHTIGHPESELSLARLLVQTYNIVVILPSYRLAPEHRFPSSFNDVFETLKQVSIEAVELSKNNTTISPKILPKNLAGKIDPASGFLVGGVSAGATLSASTFHLYHNWRTTQSPASPPITGIFFSCGSVLNPYRLPSAYAPFFKSRVQNSDAPPVDDDLWNIFKSAVKPDWKSPIWSSLDQHPELDRDKLGEDHVFIKEQDTRVYVQVCGQDIGRDDALIYEKVLREESGVETRLDLYTGFGHVFWGMGGGYAEMEMSKKRMKHSVEGVGWLLRR